MKQRHFLLIFLQIFLCNFLFAQTWNGSTSTDWNTASNWTPANVPTTAGNVIIPGGLARYPVLASNVSINHIDMRAGSKLDFKGRSLDINAGSNYNYFTGATLNNSDAGTDIIINLNSTAGNYGSYLRSNTVNDNIIFNLTCTSAFYDADNNATANTYNGNATFNVKDGLAFNLSNGSASQFNGNVTVIRTINGGASTLFNAGANVTGDFKFINNLDGAVFIGNISKTTNITGKVDLSVMQTTPAIFQLHGIKNKKTGGTINVQNTNGFSVQKDTLILESLSITGYRSASKYGEFHYNDFTGNLTIVGDAGNKGGFGTYLSSNIIKGSIDITLNGNSTTFDEGHLSNTKNNFIGNVNYTVTGTGTLAISNGDASKYDGNITILRTGAGVTNAFNSGAIIGGNFSFTNKTAGNAHFGNLTKVTSVGGKVDIVINDTTPGTIEVYRMINKTTGGIIDVKNTNGFSVQRDTLRLKSLSITGYRSASKYGEFHKNDITGNLTIAGDDGNTGGYGTYLASNIIKGNTDITLKGTSTTFDEGHLSNTKNNFIGNVNYTVTGTGTLAISNGDTSNYDGNLTINRTGAGTTNAFNSGAIIGGNFSFTNNTAGSASFGNLTKVTSVGGKVDITINDITPGAFVLHRMINKTTGGIINVQNTNGFDVEKDTLMVTSLSLTNYRSTDYGSFHYNDISGNLTISDYVDNTGGYGTYLRSNNVIGDASFTNNATHPFYDADNGNSGNHYSGNVAYNKNGSGVLTVGTGDTTSIGGGLSLNNTSIVLSKIQFSDSNDGVVQQTGNFPITIPTMIMNKGGTAKITLMDTLKVTGSLNLISGIIETGINSNLVLPDNMTYMGGSDSSYVDGPMLKIGNDAFIFPVGQNNKYAPISITAPAAVTDQFRAQYVNEIPHDAGYDSTKKDAALDHISRVEYWLLDRTAGNSDVSVALSWEDTRSGGVNDMAALRVARWDGSKWKNLGRGNTTGINTKGTIQTSAAVSSFSPFTLASITVLNPLPISISRFDAQKKKQSVSLTWTTENEINFSHFEVERADGNNHFNSIGKVSAHNGQAMQYYSFEDNQPLKGVNLYRLKLVGSDGKVVYSNVKSILFNVNGTITIYPNPAIDFIQIDGVLEGVSIEIHDAGGKLVKRILSNASNRYSVSDLRKGMYFIKIMDKENTTVSKLIIQ